MNTIKKKFFRISKAGFLICGTLLAALAALIKLQKDRLIIIPERMALWFLLVFLTALLSLILAAALHTIEKIRKCKKKQEIVLTDEKQNDNIKVALERQQSFEREK